MNNKILQVSVVSEESRNLTVLRIASAARNSVTQCYPERVQISFNAITDLHRKIVEKLRLHRIDDVQIAASIQFENDRTVSFNSLEDFKSYDLKTALRTHIITMKWSFIFDANSDGKEHMHSIYVRISERAHPGLIFQKFLSTHSEDLDSIDNEAFSPISCKIDFTDSRFSGEILSVLNDWVLTLPKAEPTFEFITWLQKNERRITTFILGTFPVVIVLGYVGIWLGLLHTETTNSVRVGVVWILGGGAIFLLSRYTATVLARFFEKQIHRICDVPVFDITSGDSNRITKYLAKSQKSIIYLIAAGFIYGTFKAAGLYLATYIFEAFR